MRTESYGVFSQAVHGQISSGRKPLNAAFELTRRCPLACAHCYNNLPAGDRQALADELTYPEVCRILDQLAEAGCLWLLLTGGEIFARKDFLDIYQHAKGRGFIITLFTNATMITEDIADYLARWRPFAIEVTLYGATRETYERLTGVPGSYQRCMRGIDLLLDRRLPVKLKTVALTINRHEVPQMRRLIEERGGGALRMDAMINPRVDCSRSPLEVRLSSEEVVALDLDEPARVAEWRNLAARHAAPRPRSDEVYACNGGLHSFAINPYGQLSLCTLSQRETYDLRRGSFQEGWHHFLGRVRGRKISRVTKCTDCQIRVVCGMCPANGELDSGGDPERPVDFLCQTAHLRATVFGIPVPPHGDCEYCPGGAGHSGLAEATVRLMRTTAGNAPSSQTTPPPGGRRHLPVLSGSAAPHPGGCAGCGA
jgi:radical SAM protein with 4Fe4S-binding SPASM domain